jgi:diguanylate cyclase (GGDEF)-like protein
MPRSELHRYLTGQVQRLLTALVAPGRARSLPREVGASLVAARLTHPSTLDQSLTVLGRHLAGGCAGNFARLAALLGGLAGGYTEALVEDIAEQHDPHTWLRQLAMHDPLTGLPNRAMFFERLGSALESHPVGVCYLDLDGFKVVNDTLGHDVGDRLLQTIADRLAETLGGDGHLVGRMGGDEFVVLVEECTGTDQMTRIARGALDAVRLPVWLDGHEINVSASIGVVDRFPAGGTPSELMKAADTTLYWAKEDGPGRWALFDAERHAREVSRYQLSARMHEALAHEAFFVEYQPLVRLSDNRVTGVEALVRWHHRELGVLGPDVFVEVAEETGLIVPLGRWVLAEACRQGRTWQDSYPDNPPLVSVNISARQVREPGIVKDVAQILAESGLSPGRLQLELTESAIMETTDEPLATLHALAELGVRIAIDDFGTGYSNLAYLRSLPVHALKLAGPFVSGSSLAECSPSEDGSGSPPQLVSDQIDREIVATVVRLAHTLDLDVTAECVENAEQADRLRELGCDTAQGWYFAPAGPADKVASLLEGPTQPT